MCATKKQLCMLLVTLIPASKFLILPALYAGLAGQDAWFAALVNFLADGLLLAACLFFVKRFEGDTFYDVLERSLGRVFARIVFFLYAVYFLLKAVVPVFEQRDYTETTLYETSPSVLTFMPFFIVSLYLSLKGLKVMSRVGEIMFWFTVAGFSLTVFLSVGTFRPYYLLPLLKNPLNRTLSAIYNAAIWYGQPIVVLFLAGRIKKEKHFYLSVAITFAATALFSVFVFALFTGIYGDIAVRQIYAIAKMTKYSIALSNVGRFDYVASLLINFASVLSLSVPAVSRQKVKKPTIPPTIRPIINVSICSSC